MRGSGWLGAALLLVGCEYGSTIETDVHLPADAGADAYEVILDGGGAPATPPDGVAACPAGVCNYQSGEGCPVDQPACFPIPDGQGNVVPACGTVTGVGTSGAACTGAAECAAGYLCAEGACRKLCCGGDWTGCAGESEHCIKRLAYGDGMGGSLETGAMLCYPVNDCEALAPEGCAKAGETCQIADPTGATACLPEGPGGAGEACPCKGGFTCVVADEGAICRRLCKAVVGGGEPYCQPGEGACVHFTRDPPGVGECTP